MVQVEQVNRNLAEKDNELAALEESLDILAPIDANGDRALKGNLSSAEEQHLESLKAWMSSGSTKQSARIKYASFDFDSRLTAVRFLLVPCTAFIISRLLTQ